ncbi:MAG: penicillin-binding protein 2 [Fimbriimonas sp.]|nr:penicillin-binding protein 2 [Fimbriimonas sp.]
MGSLFLVTAFSQIKLQTWERSSTLKLARSSKRYDLRYVDAARRGSIYTSDGKPLAQDDQSYALTINFEHVPHSDAFFMELSQATGLPASDFAGFASEPKQSKTWLEPIPASRFHDVALLKSRWRADGLSLKKSGQRTCPLGDATSCLVGVIKDYKEGKVYTGLERSMNTQLAGKDGLKIGLTDRTGAFLPMRMEAGSSPRADGQDVVLTLDSDLQVLASQAIRQAVTSNNADNGSAIVMDPHTGEILAMANWPSFDPSGAAGSQGLFGYNPSYMAELEPGSTFKILTLAEALDIGKVSMDETIDCGGEWRPTPSTKIHCDSHHGNRAHGPIRPKDAIARSCNVSAAIWATRIGRDNFLKYLDKLGLIRKSTLHVPGELRGRVNFKEPAHLLQLATFGFGQSITCTPVGLIGAFAMIGNGGVRVEPRLLSRVGSRRVETAQGTSIVRPETAQKVLDCMTAVIESDEGTGAKLRIPGYRLAGKTGTAEKVGKGEKGYVANFVGFVPAQSPKAVILVMVNNPKNGRYYGAEVAGPVFQQIAKAVIRHYNIAPTEPIVTPKAPTIKKKSKAELID